MSEVPAACPNCAARLIGRYCAACGQKVAPLYVVGGIVSIVAIASRWAIDYMNKASS